MMPERAWSSTGTPYVLAALRIVYGVLWLQQTTWKLPPDFGMASGGGLYYWTTEMVKYSFLPPHRFFVESVVLPHFVLFGWLTLLTELFIGVTQLLGVVSRLGALVALAMSSNLLIGLARHPNEWPWAYVMLLGYALLFLGTRPGRCLGVDALLSRRLSAPALAHRPWARAVRVFT
ncbi:MAG TPA: TQO small subunit DoxD [Candidatus Methylomirabilis sp.]|nr:TQO small subunit DoxD [Candidatus Methylomirabilis sp.]